MNSTPPRLPRKELFNLPDGMIYLDGNSLGPPILGSSERAVQVIESEWGEQLIGAWNSADWMSLPKRVGDRIAPVIGAPKGSVATGDTLSIKVYQALDAALKMRPDRRVVLSDRGNFPTDLYMAQGLLDTIDQGYELRTPLPEQVVDAINESVAVLMLTHVDYRTGRIHDMREITRRAHAAGVTTIWDLAHSAGAVPLSVHEVGTEFAVGCTYKYLNGGPGAPAFMYVRPDIVNSVQSPLAGWLGHRAPFAMDRGYRPAQGTERFRIGTPSVIQSVLLDHAMSVWEDVEMSEVRAASIALSEAFVAEVEARCPILKLVSPRDPQQRGSQVSFTFEHGYAVVQALIDRGVIGDFREPDIMRFGIAPLYLDQDDILQAARILESIMVEENWNNPKYLTRRAVT